MSKGFRPIEGFRRVFLMLLAMLFCVLAWLLVSAVMWALAGQPAVRHEGIGMACSVALPGRLIGSH